jgi:hypothetical protein
MPGRGFGRLSRLQSAKLSITFRARLLRPTRSAIGLAAFLVAAIAILVADLASVFAAIPAVTDHIGELNLGLVALLVTYVVVERATVLHEIEMHLRRPVVGILSSQEETYLDSTRALRMISPSKPEDRTIELASFHDRGREAASFPTRDMLFQAWEFALSRRIREGWSVRWFVLIGDVDRLDQVVARLRYHDDADRFEVRALASRQEPTTLLSPMIIAKREAFLAVDDTRHRKAGASLHIIGPEACNWVREFFDQLWASDGLLRLRTHRGISEEAIRDARTMLEQGGRL